MKQGRARKRFAKARKNYTELNSGAGIGHRRKRMTNATEDASEEVWNHVEDKKTSEDDVKGRGKESRMGKKRDRCWAST